MTQTDRQEALVRASKARALITAYLTNAGKPVTKDLILPVVADLGFDMNTLSSLLDRMASPGQELIQKVETEHPDYRWAYSCRRASSRPAEEPEPEPERTRRGRKRTAGEDIPLDIGIDPRTGALTVRLGKLVLRFLVEE